MRDAVPDEWLAEQGLHVLHYPAGDVLSDLEGVVREIMKVALERRDSFES